MPAPIPKANTGPLSNPDPVETETSERSTLYSGQLSPTSHLEESDMTDRPFHYPHGFGVASRELEPRANPARTRWIEAHDVHTEFLDAGIGCSWFAEAGDQGAVIGAT